MTKKPKEKPPSEVFYDRIKDNPQVIIEWAEREIKEYQNLIEIIKQKIK